MKVAYLLHYNGNPEGGVIKKVVNQVEYWKSKGFEVRVYIFSNNIDLQNKLKHYRITFFLECYQNYTDRIIKIILLVKMIIKWDPDLVYYRGNMYYPYIDILSRKIPMVVEINTDDVCELQLDSKFRYFYNLLTRSLLLKEVKGMIFVSNDLPKKKYFYNYLKPMIVIGNSINLTQYPYLPYPANSVPHLVFIGSCMQPWQGVDKILWLANKFSNWEFDIIGISTNEIKDIPSNITLHGFLTSDKYIPIMAKADVAIGPLALYRKGMEETSALKVLEYLAYGIPVILGYQETNLDLKEPYILQLPNTSDNVVSNVNEIYKFVNSAKGIRVKRKSITNIDVKYRENKRLAFLKSVVNNKKKV